MKKILQKTQSILFFLGYFSIITNLFANPILPYKKIDEVLKKTWDTTYPIEYKTIVKKDLLGKGIMVVKKIKQQLAAGR